MATMKGDDFRRAVAVCALVARNDKYPILRSIMLRIDGGVAYFQATNLSQCVEFECEAEGEFEGLLDTKMLQARSSVITPKPISIEQIGEAAVLKQGHAKWQVPLPKADDAWPVALFGGGSEPVFTSAPDFIGACQKASYAAEPSGSTRHMLQGVHLDGEHVVGFDGKRMSVEGLSVVGGYTIPSESLTIIIQLFKDAGQIAISRKDGWACFLSDVLLFSTKTIEEPYPDWRKYVAEPASGAVRIRGGRKELVAALDRVTAANFGRGKMQKVRLESTGKEMRMAVELEGERNEDVVVVSGDQVTAFINGPYLSQALESLDSDEVELKYWPDTYQCIIEDGSSKRLVMGLRG